MLSQQKEMKNVEYKRVEPSLNIECSRIIFSEKKYESKLEEIITPTLLAAKDPNEQARKILAAFNQHRGQSAVTTSSVRGRRISRDEFIIAHRNEVPELVPFNTSLVARAFTTPGSVTQIIRAVKQVDFFYGAHGSWVVNVPAGKYVKAWSGNKKSILLDEGPHVLHDPTFKLEEKENIVDKSAPYISHGTKHIIRVPEGKLAKIWIGSEAYLLEFRPAPYVFDTPLFRLEKAERELFENVTAKLIIHGSLKRIIPDTGEVVVAYANGTLAVLGPNPESKPYLIDSSNYRIDGFLKTSIQTLKFPSDNSKKNRREENISPDEAGYEIFTTKDSVKIGIKFSVNFEITHPEVTLKKLGSLEGINKHIENMILLDIGNVIQQYASQDFLSLEQTMLRKNFSGEEKNSVLIAMQKNMQEYGVKLLCVNFEMLKILHAEIALRIMQQSMRSVNVIADKAFMDLDAEVAKKRTNQAAEIKKIEQDHINQNLISMAEAKSRAATEEAKAILIKAQAEADAKLMLAKVEAEAIVLRAKAEKEAKELQAEAEGKAILKKGQAYRENPELLQAEVTQSGFASFKDSRPNINFTIGQPGAVEKSSMPGLTLFSQGNALAALSALQQRSVSNAEEKISLKNSPFSK